MEIDVEAGLLLKSLRLFGSSGKPAVLFRPVISEVQVPRSYQKTFSYKSTRGHHLAAIDLCPTSLSSIFLLHTMAVKNIILALAALAPAVLAQSGAWGQCEYLVFAYKVIVTNTALGGGIGWTGATTCISGYTCTYNNAYYSQCLPGTNTVATTTSTTKAGTTTTSKTGTTTTSVKGTTTTTGSGSTGTTAAASGNPFSGVALYANPYYASEISSLAIPSLSGAQATAAAEVANVPTFVWL
jgi:cellulose 1,4-beta-cellobiosidase